MVESHAKLTRKRARHGHLADIRSSHVYTIVSAPHEEPVIQQKSHFFHGSHDLHGAVPGAILIPEAFDRTMAHNIAGSPGFDLCVHASACIDSNARIRHPKFRRRHWLAKRQTKRSGRSSMKNEHGYRSLATMFVSQTQDRSRLPLMRGLRARSFTWRRYVALWHQSHD